MDETKMSPHARWIEEPIGNDGRTTVEPVDSKREAVLFNAAS